MYLCMKQKGREGTSGAMKTVQGKGVKGQSMEEKEEKRVTEQQRRA